METIAGFVDLFHVVTLIPIGRCLLMLGYELPNTIRFRTYGLTLVTGRKSHWTWSIDNPCLLILAAVTAGLWRFALPFETLVADAAPVAGIVAALLAILAGVQLYWASRLHPYIVAAALIFALLAAGQQPLAAGFAGLLLIVLPGYEQLIWRKIGPVGIWGRGSMGHAPDREQEVAAWCVVLIGLSVLVFILPPSVALPSLAIWAVWTLVLSAIVTAELIFHTNDLPLVRLSIRPVKALERYVVRLNIGDTENRAGE